MTDPKAQNLDCLHENDLHGYCYSCGEDLFAKQDPKAQDWKETVCSWYQCYSKEEKLLVLETQERMIDFIAQEIAAAEERGRREVIAELERQVEDGGSAEVILAAVKRNFTP